MGKIRTSTRRRSSSSSISKKGLSLRIKKTVKVEEFDPSQYLSKEFVGAAIMECLLNNDPEGVVELLEIYLEEHNKTAFLRDAGVARSTAYQVLKNKNPTIKTLAKIVSTIGTA